MNPVTNIQPQPDSAAISADPGQPQADMGGGACEPLATLVRIFTEKQVYELGPELKLLVRLLMVEGGEIEFSYTKIGDLIGGDHRAAKRHIEKLHEAQVVDWWAGNAGRIRLKLREPYISAARLIQKQIDSNGTIECRPEESNASDDPELMRILSLYAVAKANGQSLTVAVQPLEVDFPAA